MAQPSGKRISLLLYFVLFVSISAYRWITFDLPLITLWEIRTGFSFHILFWARSGDKCVPITNRAWKSTWQLVFIISFRSHYVCARVPLCLPLHSIRLARIEFNICSRKRRTPIFQFSVSLRSGVIGLQINCNWNRQHTHTQTARQQTERLITFWLNSPFLLITACLGGICSCLTE